MERRRLLQSLPVAAVGGLAGCLDDAGGGTTATDETTTQESTTTTPEGPSGIYVQTFVDEMVTSGMGKDEDLRAMLMLSIPHDFWNVNGSEVEKTESQDADSFHLMATIFDATEEVILPSSASTEVLADGETVTQEVTYPMLSQRMGFHYGANFGVDDFGSYTARISFEGMGAVRTTGSLAGKYDESTTVEIPFDWTSDVADQFSIRDLDQGGDRGAVRPMDMPAPQGVAPAKDELPGTVLGAEIRDGANLVTGYVEDGGRFVDDGDYLYVSARTRYNGFVVPTMGVEATVTRDGDVVFEDRLVPTLDPDASYHYGAAVDALEPGDEVTVSVPTAAQVARHEGYERAFRQLDAVSFTVGE